MSVYRMPITIWRLVEAEQKRGRPKAHIESFIGLPSGTLSRPFFIDDTAEKAAEASLAAAKVEVAAWSERQQRYWRSFGKPKPIEGWRPANDCVTDRPNAGRHFKPKRFR